MLSPAFPNRPETPGAAHRGRAWIALLLVAACAACGTSAEGTPPWGEAGMPAPGDAAIEGDGSATTDAGLDASNAAEGGTVDGGGTPQAEGGSGACELGAAGSFATDQSLDLFGDTIYFAQGQDLPAGRYRVRYVDGCMKYNALFGWTVNSPDDGWWLVGASSAERVVRLPGVEAFAFVNSIPEFADCVAMSQALDPVEFDFDGGTLGIWLNDSPYDDNQAGEGGRNPTWELTLLVEECPPDLVLF